MSDNIMDALGSEYTRVLNMQGLHVVLNSILYHWQGKKYASTSEYASVTQSSVENDPSYMSDRVLNIPGVPNMLGLEIYKDSEFTKVTQGLL